MNAMVVAHNNRLVAVQAHADALLAGRRATEFGDLYLVFKARGYTKSEFKVWLTQPCGYLHGMLPMRVWDEGDRESLVKTVTRALA